MPFTLIKEAHPERRRRKGADVQILSAVASKDGCVEVALRTAHSVAHLVCGRSCRDAIIGAAGRNGAAPCARLGFRVPHPERFAREGGRMFIAI